MGGPPPFLENSAKKKNLIFETFPNSSFAIKILTEARMPRCLCSFRKDSINQSTWPAAIKLSRLKNAEIRNNSHTNRT